MGFRYNEKEKAVFTSFDMLRAGRRIARLGDAPIDPGVDDPEALEFLYNIQMDFEDRVGDSDLSIDPLNTDIAYEIADNSVPYNDYKAALAYSQLGLYDYDEFKDDGTNVGEPIKIMRKGLYVFAYTAVENMLYDLRSI